MIIMLFLIMMINISHYTGIIKYFKEDGVDEMNEINISPMIESFNLNNFYKVHL